MEPENSPGFHVHLQGSINSSRETDLEGIPPPHVCDPDLGGGDVNFNEPNEPPIHAAPNHLKWIDFVRQCYGALCC